MEFRAIKGAVGYGDTEHAIVEDNTGGGIKRTAALRGGSEAFIRRGEGYGYRGETVFGSY